MKKIVIDVDYTISKKVETYKNALPNKKMIKVIAKYKEKGYWITLFSARNMKTFNGNLELIMKHTYPELIKWLDENGVKYDELILGKPWNDEGFYVDDSSVRPLEFLKYSEEEIKEKLDQEREELWK